MTAATPRPRRGRTRTALLVVVLLVATAVGPATAQTDEIESAKAEREAARAAAADAAAELDPLLAQDAELEAALAALELYVATQEAKVEATQQSLETAREDAADAAQRVADMDESIARLRVQLTDRAVAAYVTPDDADFDDILSSTDLTVAVHKQALLETVSGNDIDVLDQLRAAEDALADLEAEAEAAVAAVAAQEAVEVEQLRDLQDALDEEQRLKEALETRIADLTSEIDAHAAEEAQLTQLITDLIEEEEARIAAEAAAAAWAAEQERLAEEARAAAAAASAAGDSSGTTTPPPPQPTAVPLPAPSTASGLIWPTSGVLTSSYGPRWGRQHQGIDIAAPTGTAVWAAQSGTVVSAGQLGGYGNMVLIDHGNGFTTIYAHLSEIWVSAGESVGQGGNVGAMGCTGSCTGPHLHFETRVNGIPQDPMLYL